MKQHSNAEEKPVPPGYRLIRTTAEIGDMKKFDPDKMINNEIRNGENGILAKIPKNPNRIVRKESDDGIQIQFIHDRVYDPEKKQNRIRKTTIGQSVESMLRGMMLVNFRYYSFFDHDGKMIYKPTESMPEQEMNDPETLALEEVEYEPAPLREEAVAGEKNTEQEPKKVEKAEEQTSKARPVEKQVQSMSPQEETKLTWNFDATKLITNEIIFEDTVLTKIPEIPGRINRRKRPESDIGYIEMVLERHYDPASRQTRKKRISIGTDASSVFPGMMIPNETYYQYFDHDGNWIAPETDPEMKKALEKWKAAREAQQGNASGAEERSGEERTMGTEQEKDESEAAEETEENEAAEDQSMRQMVNQYVRNKEHFKYLHMLFLDYHSIVTTQTKKKPQLLMTVYQVVRINELLTELKKLFEGTDMAPYLKLVEIPEKIDGDFAPVTYGDMAILLKPYYRAINVYMYRTLQSG